jgi:uncharacterized protein (TIGR02001 family)
MNINQNDIVVIMKGSAMKKILAAAIFPTLFSGLCPAQEVKPEMKPDNEVSFNAALTSDYRYRGISQTRLQAALQGGADYVHNPSGLYAGHGSPALSGRKMPVVVVILKRICMLVAVVR